MYAQYATVFKTPFPQQYFKLDTIHSILIKKDSLTAAKAIQQMQIAAEETHDERTILNFKRLKVNYDITIMIDTCSAVTFHQLTNEIQELLVTVNEKRYPEIAAMLHVYMGNCYYFKGTGYNLAFAHYLKAYDLFKNISVETFPNRHYTQYQIALVHYQFNDFTNAIKLGKEIESLYPVKDYISVFTMQMIGLSYYNLKQYDSAKAYFTWVLNHSHLSLNPDAWKGIAMGSIGNIYFQLNRFDKALPWLDSGVVYTLRTNVSDNATDFAAHLSAIYLKQGNLTAAKQYATIAHAALHRSYTPMHDIKGFRWLSNCYTVYHVLSSYYKAVNDNNLAWMYMDSSLFYKDSLGRQHDVNLKYQGEILAEKERTAQNELLLEQQVAKQKVIRNAVIVVIGLVMLITLLLYNRNKLKNKYREKQLLAEKHYTEAELINARDRLNEFTKSIIEKNELIEQISAEVIRLQLQQQQETPASAAITADSLNGLRDSVLLTDDDWKNFTRLFDTVHFGFLLRLKEKLPGLSPAETRFLTLSKLKLNNKEMATMLGVSTDAIRQTRSRLRKKLNLTDENGLEEAVEKI